MALKTHKSTLIGMEQHPLMYLPVRIRPIEMEGFTSHDWVSHFMSLPK